MLSNSNEFIRMVLESVNWTEVIVQDMETYLTQILTVFATQEKMSGKDTIEPEMLMQFLANIYNHKLSRDTPLRLEDVQVIYQVLNTIPDTATSGNLRCMKDQLELIRTQHNQA